MSDEGEVSRHRKRCFDVAFKLKVVHFAESNSKAGAARAFNIDRKCVQMWTKQKDELIEMVGKVRSKNKKRKRLSGGGRKPANPSIEEELYRWICDLREKRLRVTRRMVTAEALRLYDEIGNEGMVDSSAQNELLYCWQPSKPLVDVMTLL